jgi:hypothetical protein
MRNVYFIIFALLIVLTLSSCGSITTTTCDTLALVVSEAVKFICITTVDTSKTSLTVFPEKSLVIAGDTVRYSIAVRSRTVAVTWQSSKGSVGSITANK